MPEVIYLSEWEKWKVNPSSKHCDSTTEFEESAIITGDAGVSGNYLEENEGICELLRDGI